MKHNRREVSKKYYTRAETRKCEKHDIAWKDFMEFSKLQNQTPSEKHFIDYLDHLKRQ